MKNRLSRPLPGKRKLLAAAVIAAFAAPATAWGQAACIHLAMQVQCPVNPGTGLALPGGSSSLAFVPGGTNWQMFGGGIVFIPMTMFAPFMAPGAPAVGGGGPATAVAPPGGIPTTAAGQLALVAPITPRLGLTYDIGEKTIAKASYAFYADNLGLDLAIGVQTVPEQYMYSYFLDISNHAFSEARQPGGRMTTYDIPVEDIGTYITDGQFPVPSVSLNPSYFQSTGSMDNDFKFGFSYRNSPVVSATFWDAGGYVVPGYGIPENGLLVAPQSLQTFSDPTTVDLGLRFDSQVSPPKTHEVVLGLTQQLGRDASIGVQLNLRHHMQPEPDKPGPQSGPFATTQAPRVFVLPHVVEKSGSIGGTAFTFDSTLFSTYAGGMNNTIRNAPNVDMYLFDTAAPPAASGVPKPADGAAVGVSGPRKVQFRIDDLIFGKRSASEKKAVVLGYGVIVVGGTSADGVNLQGFVVNSQSSAFDSSVFGFDPVPLLAAGSGGSTAKRPIELVVPPDITQNLLVTQVKTGPSAPPPKPEDTPEIKAQQDAARYLVRELTSADPERRRIAQDALKVANFQTRRLVTGLMASARLGIAQAQSDASNYAATNSLKSGP